MFDPFLAVLEFHRALGIAIGERPEMPEDGVVELRCSLIREELAELERAIADRDLVEIADALADLLYVTYGTAISFGIDIRPVFEEVHRSNMAKAGGPARADGKVLKPPGWQPPSVGPLLEAMRLPTDQSHPESS